MPIRWEMFSCASHHAMIGSRETESARTTIFAPGKRALADEFLDAVFDQLLVAAIGKTARQFSADPKTRIDLAKEQGAAVAAEMAAGEIGHDFSSTKVLKKHRVVRHSVWRESGLLLSLTCFTPNSYNTPRLLLLLSE